MPPIARTKTNVMGPTRQFYLNVNPIVFHAIQSNDRNIASHEVSKGVYFYMSKSYRLEESKVTVGKIASTMAAHIQRLVQKEAMKLVKFWQSSVNLYFNRRAYGIRYKRGPRRIKNRQQLGKVSTPYIANSRQHTGQLRNSLIISKVNIYGAELYAKRVHAKTNNADYIEILMHGARAGPRAYNPSLDLRVKGGTWRGITPKYWMNWQTRFTKELRNAEKRLSNDIEQYVEKMNILSKKEIRAARNQRHNKEFVANVSVDAKNMSKESKKTSYDKNQGGQDPIDEPWKFDDTWEGMKTKFYGEAIPRNNLSWTTELNEVIRANKRRNSGRSR